MWPRPSGFGLTASPLVEQLCSLAGLRDVTAKLNGRRRNVDGVVKAWLQAVTTQSPPHDGVEGGGVYVREVFHRAKLPYGLRRGVDV
jgi:ribosomal protein S5